jgi:branched-chain amino acid transport system ATP-binding protein
MTEPILTVCDLSKRFAGLLAVNAVSLEAKLREVHAVIGPNGAGKTTLINLLSGDLSPSSGTIRFEGSDIAGLPAHRISRLGIARSYQKTNIFPAFSVFENNAAAERALALVGLAPEAGRAAGLLSHGEQRRLEIALALATSPKVLLLDEPLAGMGTDESVQMTALIARLAAEHAIILVEHDMDAVFSVANRLTVMVNGRVLESGAPQAIRRSKAVQQAYLGADDVPALDGAP